MTLRGWSGRWRATLRHSPSIAFHHLPPNSARIGYAAEGALFISAQLSTDAVSALRKVWVLTTLWKQPSAQARNKHEAHPSRVKKKKKKMREREKEFRPNSIDFDFIGAGVSNMVSNKTNNFTEPLLALV